MEPGRRIDGHKAEKMSPKRVIRCKWSQMRLMNLHLSNGQLLYLCQTAQGPARHPARCQGPPAPISCQAHRSGGGKGQKMKANLPIEENLCKLEEFMTDFYAWWPVMHFHNLNTPLQVSGCFLPLPWWKKTKQNKNWVMNKYFWELMPPEESDSLIQNVRNYVHSILGRLLTSKPGQGI